MKKSILSVIDVAAFLFNSVTLNAQENGGKKDPAKTMVTQFMKQLEKVELKDEEQLAKLPEQAQNTFKEKSGKEKKANK